MKMETKVCKVCGVELPVSEFRKTPMKPDGIDTCNKCCSRKLAEAKAARRLEKSLGGVKANLRDSRHENLSKNCVDEVIKAN